jgi:hypothetical protein
MDKNKIIIIDISKKFFMENLQYIMIKFRYKSMVADIRIDSEIPLTEDKIKDNIINIIEGDEE